VLLPAPLGPTSAVIFPHFSVKFKPFKTSTSGLKGYEKYTSVNYK